MKGNPKQLIMYLATCDDKKFYEVKEIVDNRTLKQNRYMWELIKLISQKQYMDDTNVYIQVLEKANAKYEYLIGPEKKETEEALKKEFRAVKVVRPQYVNGKKFIIYKCFFGSSKMNKKEMMNLMQIVEDWATELDIPTLNEYNINLIEEKMKRGK